MKRLLLVSTMVLLATGGLALAATMRTAAFKGVVVGKDHGVLLVAGSKGTVRALHGNARIGSRVVVSGSHVRRVGLAHRALVRGVVLGRAHGVTFLSAARHVLAVHGGRRLAAANDATNPKPGDVELAQVEINDQGDLDEQEVEDVGQANQVTVVATVTGIGTNTITVSVNGQSLTIPVTSTAGITVGQQITLSVSFPNDEAQATPKPDDDNAAGDDDNAAGDDNGAGDDDHHATTTTTTTSATTTSSDDGDHGGHDGGGDH
jgi:hypothetical protein